MQKPGDVCENCREFWEKQEMEPQVLQRVGSTQEHKIIVAVCEYCDGPALEIHRNRKEAA